jgi:hypothetical protein
MLGVGLGRGTDAVLLTEYGISLTVPYFPYEALRDTHLVESEPVVTMEFVGTDIYTLLQFCDVSVQSVVEYTTHCAIDPTRRQAMRMSLHGYWRPAFVSMRSYLLLWHVRVGPRSLWARIR